MKRIHIVCDVLERDTADTADRIGKVLVHNILGDTDCLKDLCTLVRLDRGDTHLRCDLDNSVKNSGVVIVDCCIVVLVEHL